MTEVSIIHGDSAEVLGMLEAESVDAVVCDPPYALVSIGDRFGAEDAAPAQSGGATGVYARASAGFMGQRWDTGETAFDPGFWRKVGRVLKPGGHVVAFGGDRTYHRLACAIEDAGFEIRHSILNLVAADSAAAAFMASLSDDQRRAFGRVLEESQFGGLMAWVYGTGFPKSDNVERAVARFMCALPGRHYENTLPEPAKRQAGDHICPRCAEGERWADFGTALKPAFEPIVVARKPMIGPLARNVMAHGVGAMNVGGCRVEGEVVAAHLGGGNRRILGGDGLNGYRPGDSGQFLNTEGRWPANVIHDGSAEVVEAFPAEAGAFAPVRGSEPSAPTNGIYGQMTRAAGAFHGDAGSASRFFYGSKADEEDRLGTVHATVKPVDVMRWLVRLYTPPGGVVLDPFAGSGTTGLAAMAEGCDAILIEREQAHVDDIRRHLAWARGEGQLTRQEILRRDLAKDPGKAAGLDTPLFGGGQ